MNLTKIFIPALLVIALSTSASISSAQTIVCSGDSVVLILNGYKQGSTVWQQSSDRTTWSNASGTTYNDSLIITATTTLYYSAIVTDGTCSPYYSDTILVSVNATPPIAKPATGITQIFFTANWSASPGAIDYYLDIATDAAFNSFVPGKKNIDVGSADITYPIGGLSCNTTYYYRVRDSSDACTTRSANSNTITVTTDSCPPPLCSGTITDSRDGKVYKIIAIGEQCWMAQNLNVGTAILGKVQQTQATGIEKYCYGYNAASNMNDSSKCATYGGLYLWDEMMNYTPTVSGDKGPKGICPTGWHIPTDNEWTTLVTFLGDPATAGKKLKDTTKWTFYSNETKGTNSSGFTALPGGYRNSDGSFASQGYNAYLWSATENPLAGTPSAWNRGLSYGSAQVFRGSYNKVYYGYSVRCLKD